jgi:hypothetical protein
MGILNFREIDRPTKCEARGVRSSDLDAFEKFAEEFFEKIIAATILTRTRRGNDNALDLKLDLDGKIVLVSCKHYAHTDTSVGVELEANAMDAIISNSCDKFIGFYSTAPSAGLITMLDGFKNNPKYTFDYSIYKNTDIESALLDANNAKGWLLAARYFPQSYSNLFQRFVIPIDHYRIKDLKRSGLGWELDGPFGGIYCKNHDPVEIVKRANDSLTNALHVSFFIAALKEAIDTFPRYFGFNKQALPTEISLSDIHPLWNRELTLEYPVDCNIPIIVCALWSFWNPSLAQESYLRFSKRLSLGMCEKNLQIVFPSFLSIGNTAMYSSGKFRNIFARLVAFSPGMLNSVNGGDIVSFEKEIGVPIDWNFKNSERLEFLVDKLMGT